MRRVDKDSVPAFFQCGGHLGFSFFIDAGAGLEVKKLELKIYGYECVR